VSLNTHRPGLEGVMATDAYLAFYTDLYGATNRITFTPPSVDQRWDTGEFVTTYFSEGARGKTVLITNGVATEKRYVTDSQLKAADYFFLGGHTYDDLSEVEGQALVDAGYEPVTEEVV
jgi:hypothetical protein